MSFPCIHSIEADRYAEALGEEDAILTYADEHEISVEQARKELAEQKREAEADKAQDLADEREARADWEAMWP